ncbi:hypothetical protein DL95DRAFT_386042 [Leptodontidium sp. 2 PMI_412]|nr:hypothetical protein DL95DRAFT_386042 [Leptodontidium sp. 2 PMI_412]
MANIMDQKRCPGNFILDIASTGLGAAALVSRFSSGYRIKNIANSLSLSAGLLTEVARDVNKNEAFFKDNFAAKFQGALAKCKKEYEQIVAAVEKVHSWKKDDTDESAKGPAKGPPKRPWKKLAWGLGMTDDELSDFEDELDESYEIAMMAQVIVQLIILQVNAQKRELSPYEQHLLRSAKKSMGEFLELLHETGVGSVMLFSLNEPNYPANITQVARAVADDEKKNDETASIASLTIRNPTETSVPTPLKKGPGPGPPPPPAPISSPPPPFKAPDIYEMHRASIDPREKRSKQTIFRFLGIPLKVNRTETDVVSTFDKVPMSQDDIKAFLERNKDTKSKRPAIENLMGVPAPTSTAVYAYLGTKADPRNYQSHTWTVECVLASSMEKPKPRRFWSKKEKMATTHVIVLRGESIFRPWGGPPGPPRPGPPPGFRGPPIMPRPPQSSISSSIVSRKRSKPAAKFELSQQETENVINDYLASFSVLYDGVPVEERGAALKAIVLPTEDDSDYGSDSSSSSGSLVDD